MLPNERWELTAFRLPYLPTQIVTRCTEGEPFMVQSQPQMCTPGLSSCSTGYSCRYSSNGRYCCCGGARRHYSEEEDVNASAAEVKCSSGQALKQSTQFMTCSATTSNCPDGYYLTCTILCFVLILGKTKIKLFFWFCNDSLTCQNKKFWFSFCQNQDKIVQVRLLLPVRRKRLWLLSSNWASKYLMHFYMPQQRNKHRNTDLCPIGNAYTISGQPQMCSPTLSNCPAGYSCLYTVVGGFYCCGREGKRCGLD